ncbi:MAG: AbrB family transcriptional regulator [Burkholderiaceae bacterium]|nr:MAG: AbrB family transcriptional regulator [Burkholderiaceae bacterium]
MNSNLTSKGQVTVPKKFRDYLGLQPGAPVQFAFGPQGEVIVRAAYKMTQSSKARRLDGLRGVLATGRSTDELMALLRGYDLDASDPGLQ